MASIIVSALLRARTEPSQDMDAEAPTKNGIVVVSAADEDSVSLGRILHQSGGTRHSEAVWTLLPRPTAASASALLREAWTPIVICEAHLAPGTWQDMLADLSKLPDPPLLIVISRLADERLWAEALNLGAWDVLAKPFDATEVIRSVDSAWRHWRDRHTVS